MLKSLMAKSTLVALACSLSWSAYGLADTPKEVNIPAGELVVALDAIARQSDVELVFQPEQLEGLRTKGVTGLLTIQEAVSKLIEGTTLQLRTDANTGAMMISAPKAGGSRTTALENGGALRLAQADTSATSQGAEVSEVLVQSRRPFTDANVDIVRTEEDVQPYYIFKGEDVQNANTLMLDEFFKQRLTMNTRPGTGGILSPSNAGFQSVIDLRGMGSTGTLILVNGRRVAGATIASALSRPDINAFTPAMIERVEVLPSSASAIYGGNAIGGVINLILKRDFTGGDFRVSYDTPLDANAPITSFAGAYGWSFNEQRTNVTFSASYRDFDVLEFGDRPEIVQRGIDRILEDGPGLLYSANTPFTGGTTPNIASANGSALVLDDGRTLNSSWTYVPAGTSSATSLAQLQAGLLANAGLQNTTLADTYEGLRRQMSSAGKSTAVTAAIRHKITDRIELFGELFYNSSDSNLRRSLVTFARVVPGSAPTNPFQQDIRIFMPTRESMLIEFNAESMRAVGGATVDLPNDWRLQADYTWNRNEGNDITSPSLDAATNSAALTTALNTGTLNPFVDTMANPLNLSAFTDPATNYSYTLGVSTLNDVGVRVSGPIGYLPGGRPNLTIGLGYREEEQPRGYSDRAGAGLVTYFPVGQEVSSAYAEAMIPLVSDANDRTGLRLLEIQLATRIEDFSVDTGTASRITFPPSYTIPANETLVKVNKDYSSTNTTIGLRYKPVTSLTLRASHATAFLPPGFQQFVPGLIVPNNFQRIPDPRRGNELTQALYRTGGSESLQPMESETWNVGFLFEPTFARGLRFGAEWFRTDRENLIFSPSATLVLANEAEFPERVVRDAAAPGDPYGVGPVNFLDMGSVNASNVMMDGFDVSVGYLKRTEQMGTFSLDLLGTYIDEFTQILQVGGPQVDIVGQTWEYNGPLRFRANATLGWRRGPWGVEWTALHYSSYAIANSALKLGIQGTRFIPKQTYHNLMVSYRFAPSNLDVSLGIRNIFDKVPPFDTDQNSFNYASPFGDSRLRSVQLSLAKRF